jgi:hypothetical protein
MSKWADRLKTHGINISSCDKSDKTDRTNDEISEDKPFVASVSFVTREQDKFFSEEWLVDWFSDFAEQVAINRRNGMTEKGAQKAALVYCLKYALSADRAQRVSNGM